MSERSHAVPTPEGEYFESNRFAGLSLLLGVIAIVGARALRRRRISQSAPIQFFVALCVRLFLHALRRLLFLDHRASRDRRGVVGRCAPPVGKHCGSLLVVLAVFFMPILLLRRHLYSWMNIPPGVEHAARREARLSELAFLSAPRCSIPRLFSCARRSFCAAFR